MEASRPETAKSWPGCIADMARDEAGVVAGVGHHHRVGRQARG